MPQHAMNLFIVEDENLLRELLASTLGRLPNMNVIGSYPDGASAYQEASLKFPDVALLDINLGSGWNGVETGLRLRDVHPNIGIVLLSNYAVPDLLNSIPETQVAGWSYLLKKSVHDLHALERAIEGAANHLVVLDPELVRMVMTKRQSPLTRLTPRQTDILRLLAQGYNNSAIAKALFLSEKSIENQLTSIYATLHINSANSTQHARVKAVLAFLTQSIDSSDISDLS